MCGARRSHVLFGGLDGHYDEPEWEVMRSNLLLTDKEIATLRMFHGQRLFLTMNCALDEVRRRRLQTGTGGVAGVAGGVTRIVAGYVAVGAMATCVERRRVL